MEFSPEIKIVQPVFLLLPAAGDPLPGQIVPPPPPVVVEGEEHEHHAEAVEDSRQFRGTLQYWVRWTGWPSLTWEPWYFVNTIEAVSRFHERYPGKAGPMPEGSEKPELRARGLNVSGFAGAQSSGGGYSHGLVRDHGPSLGQDTSPFLPTVVIENQDVSNRGT